MKHTKKLIALTLSVAIVLSAMVYTSPKNTMARQLQIKIPSAENIAYTDDHGGWFGEGTAFGKLKLDKENGQVFLEQVQERESWRKLPLTDNLDILMYGGEKDGVTYSDELARRWDIPEADNGYYFFLDRLHSSHSDETLLAGSSLNITFSLYDMDTNTLYFLTKDT